MAFDQALDGHDHDQDTARTHDQPPAVAFPMMASTEGTSHGLLQTPRPGNPVELIGGVISGLLLAVWVMGVYGGIVYWAVKGSLTGVILSAIVPGFGVLSLWPLLPA